MNSASDPMMTVNQPGGMHTDSYRFIDHVMSRAVRSLSRVVGVKNITRPFWNRWRASLLDDETIMRFLTSIGSIDEWPDAASRIIEEEEARLHSYRARLGPKEEIAQLRRLSYLSHMAQWGCMALDERKVKAYRRSRDYYIEAESRAQNGLYRRVQIPWGSDCFWGNLHLPGPREDEAPLIVVVHGMDDSKEEHLRTELALQQAGFAVFCFDGPGQAESLYLQGLTWPTNFTTAVSQAITILGEEHGCRAQQVGLIGISWGGMWAIRTAAEDGRIGAVYDLGGPIDARLWHRLPYFLKAKYCQVLGVAGPEDLPEAAEAFSIRDKELLSGIRCPIRIVHGDKDPLVPLADKQWLLDTLTSLHPRQHVSLLVLENGDHCCTAYAQQIRKDAADFFHRTLDNRQPAHP